jgi:hypothetical protein
MILVADKETILKITGTINLKPLDFIEIIGNDINIYEMQDSNEYNVKSLQNISNPFESKDYQIIYLISEPEFSKLNNSKSGLLYDPPVDKNEFQKLDLLTNKITSMVTVYDEKNNINILKETIIPVASYLSRSILTTSFIMENIYVNQYEYENIKTIYEIFMTISIIRNLLIEKANGEDALKKMVYENEIRTDNNYSDIIKRIRVNFPQDYLFDKNFNPNEQLNKIVNIPSVQFEEIIPIPIEEPIETSTNNIGFSDLSREDLKAAANADLEAVRAAAATENKLKQLQKNINSASPKPVLKLPEPISSELPIQPIKPIYSSRNPFRQLNATSTSGGFRKHKKTKHYKKQTKKLIKKQYNNKRQSKKLQRKNNKSKQTKNNQ